MANFSVTNTNDGGAGSLRQAILDANALSGKDIINFDGVFADNIADTITLVGSTLVITDDLDIQGTAADLLTVKGNYTRNPNGPGGSGTRVFEISTDASVDIFGLTITNGYRPLSSLDRSGGGGIYNQGTLRLSNSTITSNYSQNEGAGI